jgi:hypothetical protein
MFLRLPPVHAEALQIVPSLHLIRLKFVSTSYLSHAVVSHTLFSGASQGNSHGKGKLFNRSPNIRA